MPNRRRVDAQDGMLAERVRRDSGYETAYEATSHGSRDVDDADTAG